MKIDNEQIDKFVEVRTRNSKDIIRSYKEDIETTNTDPDVSDDVKVKVAVTLGRKIEQEVGYQRCLADLKFMSTID